MLSHLSEGRIEEFVSEFDSRFTFSDHALDLQFSEKERLTEFLQKSRELFPDTAIDVTSVLQSGDTAVAEWKLTATETLAYGSIKPRVRISLSGVTVVQFRQGKVTRWSDYYDPLKSRRAGLAGLFTEWVEY